MRSLRLTCGLVLVTGLQYSCGPGGPGENGGVASSPPTGGQPAAVVAMVERISLGSNGAEPDGGSYQPFLSGDGQVVAFASDATNLAQGDTNSVRDIFVRDRLSKGTTRVSVRSDAVQADANSYGVKLSGNGRYVVFESEATNLVAGDTNVTTDIFVHDRQTGATTRVSVDTTGLQANSLSNYAYINYDGRYVVFYSYATNLVPNDANQTSDIFLHDRETGRTDRISVDSNGIAADGYSYCPSISEDGRFVSFISGATNLVAGDTNGFPDIFVHDRETGGTIRVSLDSNGAQADGPSFDAKISGDGRYVAFHSEATNLVPGDTNAVGDLFVRELATGRTSRVSISSRGAEGNGRSFDARISRDGRYVSFDSDATNLAGDDTNGRGDIYVHDRMAGVTSRVSLGLDGAQGHGDSYNSRISGDGRTVAFDSNAPDLAEHDLNGSSDIFLSSAHAH